MIHRRDAMLRLGQTGLGLVTLPGLLAAEPARAATSFCGAGRPRWISGIPRKMDKSDLRRCMAKNKNLCGRCSVRHWKRFQR